MTCVFQFEADPDQPCRGPLEVYSNDADNIVMVCEAHADWSLICSHADNRTHYKAEVSNETD